MNATEDMLTNILEQTKQCSKDVHVIIFTEGFQVLLLVIGKKMNYK